jgi:hypothetical protein
MRTSTCIIRFCSEWELSYILVTNRKTETAYDSYSRRVATAEREAPRGKVHSSEYLLSGIAKCGHCGGPKVGKAGYAYNGKQYKNH